VNWLQALGQGIRDEVLASHGISQDAWGLRELADNDVFLAQRSKDLIRLEREHMVREDVTLPLDLIPQPSAIDTD
jgi:hypothetical protein